MNKQEIILLYSSLELNEGNMPSEQIEILVLQPSDLTFEAVYETIIHIAASDSGAKLVRVDQMSGGIIEGIYEAIERANLIICDITGS